MSDYILAPVIERHRRDVSRHFGVERMRKYTKGLMHMQNEEEKVAKEAARIASENYLNLCAYLAQLEKNSGRSDVSHCVILGNS